MNLDSSSPSFWIILGTAMHLLCFFAISIHALRRRRNSSATILWTSLAWFLPFLGPLLYLSFGIDRVPEKGLIKQTTNQFFGDHRQKRHDSTDPFIAWHFNHAVHLAEIENPLIKQLNLLVDKIITDHPLINGNQITPLLCGDEAYPEMLEAIRNAKHHIHLQSFIIAKDRVGKDLLELLKKKAESGVQVRLLFDRFGSAPAYFKGLFRKYKNIKNFEIAGWTQANILKRQFQVNLRNHRKNLIIDGQIAFFGGVNIAKENLSDAQQPAIRDYHFKVIGPLIHELQYSFLRDWFFITDAPIGTLLCAEYFPKTQTSGNVKARLIDSGPSKAYGLLGEVFFNAIILAQTQILVVTPYFVPTPDILKALESAARRGVDVRIILPEKNNHRYAGQASRALYEELLIAGVRIFERKPPFIHAKAMLVDDCIAVVGTANLDIRSLELNYETTVLINDEPTANKIKYNIHEELEHSCEIHLNDWLDRPFIQKLSENLSILLAPIL